MSRSQPASGPTISLFPFLAVLLCTMGALLVVLVLFSRAVREGAVAEADGGSEQLAQELELARDSLAWRKQQLEGVRQRTSEDLVKARMQLAGVEENTRALEDELKKLERMAAALESPGAAAAADESVLRELEARLASARESLEKARAEQRTKPPAYAVVPYVGRNGTHRRPLYIECAGDGVFLQPENIRLGPADFTGPPGPGNPLASALRAAREHILVAQGGAADPAMQPYPLLIVRPSGVMAYYAAREAIQSWGSDFGYQLIDEDWTLTFPPADPTLAQVEKRAIEESRQRLAWLAEVRPVRQAKAPRQYRAAPTRGGVISDEGPSVLGDQSRWDWSKGEDAGAGGDALGTGRGGGDGGGNGRGTGVGGLASGGDVGGGYGGGTRQSVFGGGQGQGMGASGAGGAGERASGGAGRVGGGGEQAAAGGPGGMTAAGPRSAGGGAGAASGGDAEASGSFAPAGATAARGQGTPGGTAAGNSLAGGGSAGSAGSSSSSAAGGGSAGGGSGPAMPGLAQSGGGGQSGTPPAGSSASASVSMAQSRGKNWASLATQERPIPLTRPIKLECSVDAFSLMDDSGRRVQTRIPIDGETSLAIDPLVKAVHARVETWGIAGDRMYWKPVLVLSETADGRSRREDLERLLADSGLDVRASDGRDTVRPLPPVERATTAATRR